MSAKSSLSFNTPKVKAKVEGKLRDYQKRYGTSDRDMTYILMQELFHYYIKSFN